MKTEKIFKVIIFEDENGDKIMKREQSGFSPLELIGMLDFCKQDIVDQIKGKSEPPKIEKTYYEEIKEIKD